MDFEPSCAICGAAPSPQECPHESERLTIALKQAEERAMEPRLAEIQHWVLNHARTQILAHFNGLTALRRQQHATYLASLPCYTVYMQYRRRPPIHPGQIAHLEMQIAAASKMLTNGINEDWRNSVLRYPEVLDYYYSLVRLKLPSDESPEVVRPFIGVGSGLAQVRERKKHRHRDSVGEDERHRHRRREKERENRVPPAPQVPMPGSFPASAYPRAY
ncbi:hypothetical protein LTR66_012866 [Elasticomyces elasticus]|nr:hypothetical protein LTR66_012866 [Elasticomyces elasticus]KAK4970436.1 hypothetical protein LTR28_000318 [Elasticomyces elasticus]